MTNEMKIFQFEGADVRIIERDDDPWWVLADVCKVLEIANPSDAVTRLDADERSTLGNTEGGPDRIIVSEPGLYRLIMRSRKPKAKRFTRWVCHEVLPSIRKTGQYGAPPGFVPAFLKHLPSFIEEAMREHVSELKEKIAKLEARIELDPHRAVPWLISANELAIQYKADQKGRRALSVLLGNKLVKRAKDFGVAHTVLRTMDKKRMFDQKFARQFMIDTGIELIALHNKGVKSIDERKNKQGNLFDLEEARKAKEKET
jgi:prophage antirepressor-like protein